MPPDNSQPSTPLPQPSEPPGKILALDVSDTRVGVATCDPLGLTVRPLCVIRRRTRRQDFDALAHIYAQEEACLVVCGLPLNMDGSTGPQAHKVRTWAARFDVPCGLSAAKRCRSSSGMNASAVGPRTNGPPPMDRTQPERMRSPLLLFCGAFWTPAAQDRQPTMGVSTCLLHREA